MTSTTQSRRPISQTFYAPPTATHSAPSGTFSPGTKVQVGSHRVVIEKYLSEGGFSHVYTVKLPAPDNGIAVLKRVAVPDKDTLANMRNEVETMKKLRGQKSIVTYIDSHASQLKGGGYEVFLLMEFCSGGGLIDFMNTRLKNRLTEPEILDIIGDAAESVACMHYLKPPLIHRDLKVENILITRTPDGRKRYKLCDFGSAAPPRPAPSSAAEGRLIEEDVQRHTTLQYRSPEMIDVYRHKPIDEKSDIWALGVLLYKLCYYTTPFEDRGQMAILSASFKYPAYPPFSDRIKRMIAIMLMEDPARRPNIYQAVKEISEMRGKACPISDIYSKRTQSEARAVARNSQQLPPRESSLKSPPMVGAKIEAPEEVKQFIPEVKPMRRGRPAAVAEQSNSARPSSLPNAKTSPTSDQKASPLPSVNSTVSKFNANLTSQLDTKPATGLTRSSSTRISSSAAAKDTNRRSSSRLDPSSIAKFDATQRQRGTSPTPLGALSNLKSGGNPSPALNATPVLRPSMTPATDVKTTSPAQPKATMPPKSTASSTFVTKPGADPFAALDTALKSDDRDDIAKAVDELSLKYPALDDFSSLESRGKFQFRNGPPKVPSKPASLRGRRCAET